MSNEDFRKVSGKKITESELVEMLAELDIVRTLVAYFTDRADCVNSITANATKKLLELRAFSETDEFYACRSLTGADFLCRYVDDGAFPTDGEDKMLEIHYLDIDGTYPAHSIEKDGMYEYKTMTGGVYHLPVRNADRLVLCNYIRYDNAEGLAQVYDYRFVKFLPEGEALQ